jgi:ADP-ribosylglycohydrolase
LANGEILYDEIMGNFVKWANLDDYTPTGEMFDIGVTCKKAIRKFVEEEGISPLACGLPYENANGNGSLMRIHPFVLMAYFREDLRPLADMIFENASRLTHAHERSVLACKIYGRVLFSLIEKPSRESVFKALAEAKAIYADNSEYSAYRRLFSDDFEALTAREIRSSGYVVDTLEAAIWCLLTTGNYAECVLKAVNLGEDTDTVGAVAGGLAGALYGYETIPKKWRDTLIKRAYIEEMCDRAAKNW